MLVSKDFEYSAPREGYEHEYTETKEVFEFLTRLMHGNNFTFYDEIKKHVENKINSTKIPLFCYEQGN